MSVLSRWQRLAAVLCPRWGQVGSAEIPVFALSVCIAVLPSSAVTPGLGLGFLDVAGNVRTCQMHRGIAVLNEQEGCALLMYPSYENEISAGSYSGSKEDVLPEQASSHVLPRSLLGMFSCLDKV